MSVDLRDLVRVERAAVFKKGRRAATLVRLRDRVRLTYDEEYAAGGGAALASTLPVTPDPVDTVAGALPAYFANLLPEGRRLAALRVAVKTSLDDELSLLLAVGADAVGDVQVLPDGSAPEATASRVEARRWSEVSFAEVFSAETGDDPDRVALPGVQPKASARMISFPVRRGTDHFILKLDPPEFPHLCRNEWLMLRAARASGLATVEAELVTDRDGREALAVQRFDRTADGGLLAVEDACQVLGRYPADKYALTTEAGTQGLAAVSSAPLVVARTLLRWVAFAYLSGNGDLHGKNLAVAERPDGTVLAAPAYDLPSSYPYGDTTMALPLAGKTRDDIGRRDLLGLAAGLGLPERAATKVLDEVVDAVDGWLPLLDESGFPARTVHKWSRFTRNRRQRLAASST
jgi:serine/threonine-protein kinase HipA